MHRRYSRPSATRTAKTEPYPGGGPFSHYALTVDFWAAEKVGVHVVRDDDPHVIRVTGRVLYDTLGPLAELFARLGTSPPARVVLDLSDVPMCDSSGLNLMVKARRDLVAGGGWLRLAGIQPMVGKVLEITNLIRILPCYTTADEAAQAPG
jgi:anti-anti-sigma factor